MKIDKCYLFTDSTTVVHWLTNHSVYFGKQQNLSVFVKNRLRSIDEITQKLPITFRHIAGGSNPADMMTRATSFKVASKSNFYKGPDIMHGDLDSFDEELFISLPNPLCVQEDEVPATKTISETNISEIRGIDEVKFKLDPEKFSSFSKLKNVSFYVRKFVNKLKAKVNQKLGYKKYVSRMRSFLNYRHMI